MQKTRGDQHLLFTISDKKKSEKDYFTGTNFVP